MRATLFQKTLRDDRRSLIWWFIGLSAAAGLYMSIYPSVRASASQMSQYLDRLPEALRALFVGKGALDFSTVNGYLKMEVFPLMFPLLLLIFAIGAGARAIAGEEQRGTIEVLLAAPVSRTRIVAEKAAAMIASTTAIAVVFVAVLLAVAALTRGRASYLRIIQTSMSALFVAVAFGMLTLAIGCVRGRRGAAVGGASGLAVAMYLVSVLGETVSWLQPYRKLSLFYYYWSSDPLTFGPKLVHLLVIVMFAVACATVALVAFERRDVGT